MVGFDDDDRRFRPKATIQLECIKCGETGADVRRRAHWHYPKAEAVTCQRCWHVWTPTEEEMRA